MPGAFPGVAGAGAGHRPADHRPADRICAQVEEKLKAAGIRATVDERNEKVNLKIREAQLQKIPYMLVVGDREAEAARLRCAIANAPIWARLMWTIS